MRWTFIIACLFFAIIPGQVFADNGLPISNLTPGGNLLTGDILPATRDGVTYSVIYTGGNASAFSALTNSTTANTVNNFGYAQTWDWTSLQGITGLSISGLALTSGTLLNVTVAGPGNTGYAGFFSNPSSTGYGLYVQGNQGISENLTVLGNAALDGTTTINTAEILGGNALVTTLTATNIEGTGSASLAGTTIVDNLTVTGTCIGCAGIATASLSSLTAAIGINAIDNGLYPQTWTWNDLATGTALSLSSNSATSGTLLNASITAANNSGYAGYFQNTASGNTGYALYANGAFLASGAATFSSLGAGAVVTNSSGTLSSGTLSVANGGTGDTSLTNNGILYGTGTSGIRATTTAANSALISSSTGIPSWSQTLPTAIQANITGLGTVTTGVWQGGVVQPSYLATATSSAKGIVEPDNTTITVNNGMISAVGSGYQYEQVITTGLTATTSNVGTNVLFNDATSGVKTLTIPAPAGTKKIITVTDVLGNAGTANNYIQVVPVSGTIIGNAGPYTNYGSNTFYDSPTLNAWISQ